MKRRLFTALAVGVLVTEIIILIAVRNSPNPMPAVKPSTRSSVKEVSVFPYNHEVSAFSREMFELMKPQITQELASWVGMDKQTLTTTLDSIMRSRSLDRLAVALRSATYYPVHLLLVRLPREGGYAWVAIVLADDQVTSIWVSPGNMTIHSGVYHLLAGSGGDDKVLACWN